MRSGAGRRPQDTWTQVCVKQPDFWLLAWCTGQLAATQRTAAGCCRRGSCGMSSAATLACLMVLHCLTPAPALSRPYQALRLDDTWRPLAEAMAEFEERALQLQVGNVACW